MSKKKTHEEYVKELKIKNPTVEVVEQYAGANTSILHRCLIHDMYWDTTPSRALMGIGCQQCKKEKLSQQKVKSHEQYVKDVALVNPDIIVVGEYVNANTKITHYCTKHNISWDAYPESILHGCGCNECCREKIGDKNRKTHIQYVDEVGKVNTNIEVLGTYIDSKTPILHKCKKHEMAWKASPNSILSGCGCPVCGGTMKKTHEQYVHEVSLINPSIEVLDTYINARTPIAHRCNLDGYIWDAAPYAVLRGDGCPKCAGNARKTHSEYVQELKDINHYIEVLEEYRGANTRILHKCNIDGYKWLSTPANILFGYGCPECSRRRLSDRFSKTHEQYVRELSVTNPNIEVLEEYVNSKTPILHKCKIDGNEWKAAPGNILFGQGCPKCQSSKGEKRIAQWLQENNITYVQQKTFTECKDKKVLPFDFYIPDHNLCIEYDGEQHFKPINFSGKGDEWALNQLSITQMHDNIKNQYCKDNNIRLLRIPYFKNIESELEHFLFI